MTEIERAARSIYAIGPLQFSHINDDRIHLLWFNVFDCGHVAELPMMGPDPIANRAVKRPVGVMVGLIDLMD